MYIDTSRQCLINGMTEKKDKALKASHVLIIGAGGLAMTAMTYIVMSGVEHVTIVDFDHVEASNLHRQTLYTFKNIGKKKAELARDYFIDRAPTAKIISITKKLNDKELLEQIRHHDIILDCTDKRVTSYQISDCASIAKKPVIFANASEMSGQILVMIPKGDNFPNFRSVWGESIDNTGKKTLGVIGPVPGVVGSFQALEAIKVLTDFSPPNQSLLIHIDFNTLLIHQIKI